MGNLKRYLDFRDNHPKFKKIKFMKRLGVPCVVVDGDVVAFGQPKLSDLK